MSVFDPLAPDYDTTFTHSSIARFLRGRVHARLQAHFSAGAQVLELGCGTGEDARWLAARGVSVLATDASPAMLAAAQSKNADMPGIRYELLDLHNLPSGLAGPFDGALASFGPVNVLADRRPLARWLAARIRPGGVVGLGVMGPLCPWEIVWHGAHLNFRTATRRLRGAASFATASGQIPIFYPTLRQITAEFAPDFRPVFALGLGVFLPPSDVYGIIERHPRWLRLLITLEGWWSPPHLADHYWIELVRV